MEFNKHPPELAAPPPELELRPEREITAPPPEFGQGTTTPEAEKSKRRWRRLLAAAAVLLAGALFVHGERSEPVPPAPTEPGLPEILPTDVSAEPVPTAETVPSETLPIETVTEAPNLPQGSVAFDVIYAVRRDEAVLYCYDLYIPIPSEGATWEQIEAYHNSFWPVSVYAQVSDADGRAVHREGDPDVWTDYRSRAEYAMNAAGLEGELTLTLTAVYTEDGEERCSTWSGTLTEIPPAPTLSATLERLPRSDDIEFTAVMLPQPGDDHEYELEVWNQGQIVYDGEETMGLSLGADPSEGVVEGDRESGFTFRYSGGCALGFLPEDLELSVYVSLRDVTTGYTYYMESNRIPTGSNMPTYPLESGKVVITVYNDTTSFEYPSRIEGDDGYLTLLTAEAFDAASFESYELPDPLPPRGFTFAGWVIHVNDPFDYSSDAGLFEDYNGDPPRETMLNDSNYAFPVDFILTREDLEKVPPDEEGNRFVNVHAVWYKEDSEGLLTLDDGLGSAVRYSMEVPLASEGYLYLCRYPVPTHPDSLAFDGWYDDDGNRVDLLVSFFSFYEELRNDDGSFAGYDWGNYEPVYLTAHWK